MIKKIGLVLLFLAVTVGIGFALYRIVFGPLSPAEIPPGGEDLVNVAPGGLPSAQPGTPTGTPTGTETGLPNAQVSPVASGGLTKVTTIAPVPTSGAMLTSLGDLNYYNRNDGKFYRVLSDGTIQQLSGKTFFNVEQASFSPKGDTAIIEYPDGSNIFYDFNSDKQVTLPKHWQDFDFSPQGSSIVAKSIGLDPANRFLIISSPDGSNARPIQELGNNADKVQVAWSPNNQIVATATTGDKRGVDGQEVFFLGQNHENFRSIMVDGLDFRPSWAPDGERLLYSVAGSLSDYKPQLWIVDASGDDIGLNRRMLNVNTWSDKCTFAGTNMLYCAVPRDLPRGAGLQPTVADSTPDDIIGIDLTTGLQTQVAIPEGNHTVGSIMVTADHSKLLFTDRGSGMLNELRLR
ncbi:MAG: hypothetical protein AUJ19_03820 [Parcubacteria group bacterium CG1_02_58_44]|nr:MAG: hypothetical protein AUJ19_03820 [Parcubacteria group bacterium CG1_02_58_44]